MMNTWMREDIEAILIQLNKRNLPFRKYRFTALGDGLNLLGKGASANVYEAMTREKQRAEYAIKVIGFSDRHADSESFRKSVEAQKDLSLYENNVVKIYDSIELRVWIEGEHKVTKVEKKESEEENKLEGNFIHLQFILMEKITPIFKIDKFTHTLLPHKLAMYDEKEILKLAYDIGTALSRAHKKKLIHRDIKLENIFYSSKDDHYKLGDFGIARTTDNGMASTVAFTKGYGAPEVVGTLEDKYDYTADIYSFGMMLYVLLNEIRFPESKNYHPNVYQYVQGYTAPEPVKGSDELCRIVLKMISFYPDDRYQSMEEVLNEFDQLKYGRILKYQREHKNTSLVLGIAFALMGAVAGYQELKWATVLLWSLAAVLLFQYCVLGERDEKITKMYFGKNLYWGIVTLCYMMLTVASSIIVVLGDYPQNFFVKIFGQEKIVLFLSYNPMLVGIFGTIFCVIWVLRELILVYIEKLYKKREKMSQL